MYKTLLNESHSCEIGFDDDDICSKWGSEKGENWRQNAPSRTNNELAAQQGVETIEVGEPSGEQQIPMAQVQSKPHIPYHLRQYGEEEPYSPQKHKSIPYAQRNYKKLIGGAGEFGACKEDGQSVNDEPVSAFKPIKETPARIPISVVIGAVTHQNGPYHKPKYQNEGDEYEKNSVRSRRSRKEIVSSKQEYEEKRQPRHRVEHCNGNERRRRRNSRERERRRESSSEDSSESEEVLTPREQRQKRRAEKFLKTLKDAANICFFRNPYFEGIPEEAGDSHGASRNERPTSATGIRSKSKQVGKGRSKSIPVKDRNTTVNNKTKLPAMSKAALLKKSTWIDCAGTDPNKKAAYFKPRHVQTNLIDAIRNQVNNPNVPSYAYPSFVQPPCLGYKHKSLNQSYPRMENIRQDINHEIPKNGVDA